MANLAFYEAKGWEDDVAIIKNYGDADEEILWSTYTASDKKALWDMKKGERIITIKPIKLKEPGFTEDMEDFKGPIPKGTSGRVIGWDNKGNYIVGWDIDNMGVSTTIYPKDSGSLESLSL